MGRHALLIACDRYEDSELQRLRSPSQDVDRLSSVLRDPQAGEFDSVRVLIDRPDYDIRREIEDFAADRLPQDLLVLYMSCHGIQDRRGRLHFAASNTRRDRLAGTAVEAAFVNAQFENSFAGGRVVMLDCCFSGSFASGFVGKSALGSPLAGEVGRGYVVLTATDAFEYAFEGRNLTLNEPQPSLFTDAIARGLTVPEADRDRDGWISTTDLYDYVYSDVARRAEQKPGYFAIGVEGKILLSRVVHSSGPRGGAPESSPAIRIEAPYLGDGSATSNSSPDLGPSNRVPPDQPPNPDRTSEPPPATWPSVSSPEDLQHATATHAGTARSRGDTRGPAKFGQDSPLRPDVGQRRARKRRWLAAAVAVVVAIGLPFSVRLLPDHGKPATEARQSSGISSPAASGPVCGRSLAFVGAMTGSFAALGLRMQRGASLATDDYNEHHASCKVTLRDFDTQGKPEMASAVAPTVVRDSTVVGVIGPSFSPEIEAAMPVFQQASVPIVAPAAPSSSLSTRGWSMFHRIIGDDQHAGTAAAIYLRDVVRAQRVLVVDDGSSYGRELTTRVRDVLGKAANETANIKPGGNDFSAVVQKARTAGAQAIFFGGYYQEAAVLVRQLRSSGSKAQLVGGDGIFDGAFISAAGSAAQGVVAVSPVAPSNRVSSTFVSEYTKKFGSPDTYAAEGYDAAVVLLQALDHGESTPTRVNNFLREEHVDGLTKKIAFDARGEVIDPPAWIYRVKGGGFEPQRTVSS